MQVHSRISSTKQRATPIITHCFMKNSEYLSSFICSRSRPLDNPTSHAFIIFSLKAWESTRDCCQLVYSRTAVSRGIFGATKGSIVQESEGTNSDGGEHADFCIIDDEGDAVGRRWILIGGQGDSAAGFLGSFRWRSSRCCSFAYSWV